MSNENFIFLAKFPEFLRFCHFSNSFRRDYDTRDNALIVTSGMTGQNRAPWNFRHSGIGHTGIYTPFFATKVTKFPKRPLHDHREGTGNSPNGRSCFRGNLFSNFNDDNICGRRTVAISANPATIDHTHMIELFNTAFQLKLEN